MPRYLHGETTGSGVPLGGLGCGKLELLPDGTLSNFTHQNNWGAPLAQVRAPNGIEARVGHHFGVFAETAARRTVLALQTAPLGDRPVAQDIVYDGVYPFARLEYRAPSLPLEVALEAFTPLIPGAAEDAAYPVAVFVFRLRNPGGEPVRAGLFCSIRNTVSAWNVGRYNTLVERACARGVQCGAVHPLPGDEAAGTICLAADRTRAEVTVHGGWNLKTADPFRLTVENVDLEPAWGPFAETGALPDTAPPGALEGEGWELGAAVAARLTLGPGESREVPFILAWHMPVHHIGHAYERRFDSADEAAEHVLANLAVLRDRTLRWTREITSSTLPEWLRDALLNNLYVFSASSWYGRRGEFALFEAPEACQLMDTVDVRFYASLALAWLFPGLNATGLRQIARAQRPDGYVPHDLGRGRLDLPNDGTTAPPRWKDLCPKFVLMVYQHYLWTGGAALLAELYPAVKAALEWENRADHDGDGLPENEGADQTFDMWRQEGTQAYTSSLYLAALRAGEAMAGALGDDAFRERCATRFSRGRQAFIDLLWTGEFFRACAPSAKGPAGDLCTVGQLAGQWYSHLLGLGYLLPQETVKSAVAAMLRLNGRDSRYGATNAVYGSGLRDLANEHSRNIWPGATYALAALAIYEGMAEEGLELAARVWDNIAHRIKNPWNQPDVIRAEDGSFGFGDHYMRNSAVWALLFALAARDDQVKALLDGVKG